MERVIMKTKYLLLLMLLGLGFVFYSQNVRAEETVIVDDDYDWDEPEEDPNEIWNRGLAAVRDENGQLVFNVQVPQKYYDEETGELWYEDDQEYIDWVNTKNLMYLMEMEGPKTIVIPSGSKIGLTQTMYMYSDTKIIAKGATITQTASRSNKKTCGIMNNAPTCTNYNSLKNFTIEGGTWTTQYTSADTTASLFRIGHAQNIKFINCTITPTYSGHGIELIAVKDATIKGCIIKAKGSKKANSVEEAIQIDIAESHTAPGFGSYYNKAALWNGACCKNITIDSCTVSGCRGICANFAAKGTTTMKNKFHDKIIVKNCTVTGQTGEALALFNVLNATVNKNTLISNSKRKSGKSYTCYTLGLNITMQGKNGSASNATINITNNTIKGARNGLQVVSLKKSKYKVVNCKSNKVYCRAGKKKAINVSSGATKKKVLSKNKTYKW